MELGRDFSRSRLTWTDPLTVGELQVSADFILRELETHLTQERIERLNTVIAHRTTHLIPVLENIYDDGNVSAVMRSAEAFGFLKMMMVDLPGAKFKAANRVARGADKWLDIERFRSPDEAVQALKAQGYQIWATDLNTENTIASIDWSKPTAIVLGNEKEGTSREMLAQVDGRFRIPMMGFSQSFNISVAGALIFYHAHLEIQKLGSKALLTETQRRQVLANYFLRCFDNPESLLRQKL